MKTCVFIAVVVVVGLSGGRFPDEKACCLSSKTRQKNVCSGRMTGLSTEMALVKEVTERLTVEVLCDETRMLSRLTAVNPEDAILGTDQKERGHWGRE